MKYLKLFEIFKLDLNNIKLDCEEILLELKDIGFEFYIKVQPISNNTTARSHIKKPEIDWITIRIKNKIKFQIEDVEEYVYRLIDYLKEYNLIPPNEFNHKLIVEREFDVETRSYFWQLELYFDRYKNNI